MSVRCLSPAMQSRACRGRRGMPWKPVLCLCRRDPPLCAGSDETSVAMAGVVVVPERAECGGEETVVVVVVMMKVE